MKRTDGCQSVLYVAKQFRRSDRDVGADVSPVQMDRNGKGFGQSTHLHEFDQRFTDFIDSESRIPIG